MKRLFLSILALTIAATAIAQSTFTSTLAAKAAKGATIYGVVECDGTPLEGVAVSDGYNIVKTDKKGVYNLVSEKKNGTVFITIPSGYEAYTEGDDVVPQFWAHLLAEANYPTQFFNTMGNHDNDGATPCDENTDWNASAKYRKAFGPTYYSVNIGKVHYIMLDNQVYLNEPLPNAKPGKNIVGARNRVTSITRAQLDWLAKDLATVTDN